MTNPNRSQVPVIDETAAQKTSRLSGESLRWLEVMLKGKAQNCFGEATIRIIWKGGQIDQIVYGDQVSSK